MNHKNNDEKSNIVLRTVFLKDGKEKVIEESIDNIKNNNSLLSEEEFGVLFDSIFPSEEENK